MCVFVSMNGSSNGQGGYHSSEPPAIGTSLLGHDDEHELTRLIFLLFPDTLQCNALTTIVDAEMFYFYGKCYKNVDLTQSI